MDSVAPEIAQEITMFFEYRDIDASAPKQKAEHHAGRTPAYNAATNFNLFHNTSSCDSRQQKYRQGSTSVNAIALQGCGAPDGAAYVS